MAPTTSTSATTTTTDADITIAPVCPTCWTVGDDGNCQPDQDKIHVTCAPSGIIVQVDRCISPDTSSAFLNDDQCEATIGDEFITVSFGLDQCGTKMEFSETLLDFNNEIFLRTGNGVIMMNEVSIDVSCSYQTNYVVEIATNVIAEDQSVDLDEHDGEFQFGIMHGEEDTGPFNVGDVMTFDVAPKSAIPKDLSFTVTECTVEDNQSGLSYSIVQNSCPNTLVNMAFDQFSSNDGIEMTYTAFQFVQLANQETQQTLKCSVHVCADNDSNSICHNPPSQDTCQDEIFQ